MFKKTKLLVLDVDGVMTDGGIYFGSNNIILRKFNVQDGVGIDLLHNYGIHVAIISGGIKAGVVERASKLKIKFCYTGIKNKHKPLLKIQKKLKINSSNTVFLGDDINDLDVKPYVSHLISVKNGNIFFKRNADLILKNRGGEGAIREMAEKILIDQKFLSKSKISSFFKDK